MTKYRTDHATRLILPDDRLVHYELEDDGLLRFLYRADFVHEDVVVDLDEISRHMARSGVIDLGPPEKGSTIEVYFDTIKADTLLAAGMRAHWTGTRLSLAIICRDDLIRPEMIKEMNDEVLPNCLTALRTTPRIPPPPGIRLVNGLADL